jgi:hypothetical protein
VQTDGNGMLSLNYAGFAPYMIKAIQQLAKQLTDLATTVASFADSFTTTKQLNYVRAIGQELLCLTHVPSDVNPVCITKSQLAAVLAASNQSSSATPPSSPGSNASTTPATPPTGSPPVIQINGERPAIIPVGATYEDLGATIEGPQADLNLGITTYVNGALMNPVQIDTGAVATDTVAYAVTDQSGLAATSTQTVIIQAPSILNRPGHSQPRINSLTHLVLYLPHHHLSTKWQVMTCPKSCPKTATYRCRRSLQLAALTPSAGTKTF